MDATVFPDFKFLKKVFVNYLVNDLINILVDDGLSIILDQCSFTCLLKRLFSTIFLEFTLVNNLVGDGLSMIFSVAKQL